MLTNFGFRTLVDRNADPRVTQRPHATVKEFQRLDSITPIQTPKRSRLGRSGEKDHAS
jgi:phage head maturation protease